MAAKSQGLILNLTSNVTQKFIIAWVHSACEHKLLPDHKAKFITSFVEGRGLVDTTTPNSNHVVIRLNCCLDDVLPVLIGNPGFKQIDRDEISSLHKYRDVVDLKVKHRRCGLSRHISWDLILN